MQRRSNCRFTWKLRSLRKSGGNLYSNKIKFELVLRNLSNYSPASDISHELAKYKNFGIKTFQAEDEIAAVCSTIGASFGGSLGVTASSGPGIALKGEAIGLATMLEIPLVICNIQRGGPSTGLPTKTEQADLLQAMYGRNGEGPVAIISASTPSDCFDTAYEACRIAVEHMTPVFFLSDGYIANGSEPWIFPSAKDLKPWIILYTEETESRAAATKREKELKSSKVRLFIRSLLH